MLTKYLMKAVVGLLINNYLYSNRVEEIEALMEEGRREEVTFPQQEGKHPSQKN